MRWLVFALALAVAALLGTSIYFKFFWEAPPEDISSEKISNESLPENDPVAFLQKCLEHFDRTVHGYSMIMLKQERIDGKLQKPEKIKVLVREKPFSVYMEWLAGARLAERALYVAGENKGMMLARPKGPIRRLIAGNIVERDPEGAEAKRSGRYPINEFGLKKSLVRILRAWEKARARGALHVKYLGVYAVEEVNNRPCFKFQRTYDEPEEGDIRFLELYIDKETLLLAGTVLKDGTGKNAKLLGAYFFRDVKINPEFKPDQFTRKALIP